MTLHHHAEKRTRIYNKLYTLLEEHFPNHRGPQGGLDVTRLAGDMGLSHETLYRALRYDEIKTRAALLVIQLSHHLHPEMPLYWDNFTQFILPQYERYRDPTVV